MRQLGIANNVSGEAIRRALSTPYPRSERIIADAIGEPPHAIWPSRYDANGNSNRPTGRLPMRPNATRHIRSQSSTPAANSNMQTHKTA